MSELYRGRALDFLSTTAVVSFSTNATYDFGVWDGKKYDIIDGSIYADRSGDLVIQQAHVSGFWDISQTVSIQSGQTQVFSVPLVGRYVNMAFAGVSGATPTSANFRLGSWGKHHSKQSTETVIAKSSGEVSITKHPSMSGNTPLAISVGSGSTKILSGNTARVGAVLTNDGTAPIYVAIGRAAVKSQSIRLNPAGGTMVLSEGGPLFSKDDIYGATGSGSQTITAQELI